MNTPSLEYLVRYGKAGDFGRFRSHLPLQLTRGELVVIETHRGIEAGEIISPSFPTITTFLPNTTVGKLNRTFLPSDENQTLINQTNSERIFFAAQETAAALNLPAAIMDVEVLLDCKHAILHLAAEPKCDLRDLVSKISQDFDLHIFVENTNLPLQETPPETSCGSGNCGSKGSDCGSCSSKGGCGSCSSNGKEKKPKLEDETPKLRPWSLA